jgi:ABC-type lipoprotein release transport system permease subunit
VTGIVLTATTLAALIPALRAALVEPIGALRDE